MNRCRHTLGILIVHMCGLATGLAQAQQTLPGTDIRTWATADITSRLSIAGIWQPFVPAGSNAGLVGPFWNIMKTGADQREGVALSGWVYNGSFSSTLADVTTVNAALFAQQGNGTLVDATASMLGSSQTNGAGSVVVADFNGDGLDDLVFPAHNESPFLWKASTAWMSTAGGTLTRIVLPDAVMNHDAKVVTLDGRKKIFSRSFGGSGNNGNGPGFNVIYTWNGSNFTVDQMGDLGGQSVLAGHFTANDDNWLIIGDSTWGPGIAYYPANAMLNYAYKYNGGVLTLPPVLLPKPYFNDKPQFAGFRSFWDPQSKTHTSRLWTTDLNQDGLLDILAGQEIWSDTAGLQKAVFQLLINRGNMAFEDWTDELAPEFSLESIIDYSVRLVDVDHSGIDTIFLAPPKVHQISDDQDKQGQYILVNDGTGRLYSAMHSEFRAMRTQIAAFLQAQRPAGTYVDPGYTPQFIAYRTPAGALNFVAILAYSDPANTKSSTYGAVNVSLQINLATDFRRDLTIPTRNGSRRIRTFAGNDTIHRALSDPDCAIDGGLGTNVVVYPGPRSDWIVSRSSDKVLVRPVAGGGGTDTLRNIQQAKFSEMTLNLADITQSALSTSVASLDFGGQSIRTTSPAQSVTITNSGNTTLTITNVAASSGYAVSHNCASLLAGGSCAASVTLTPTVQGNLAGTLAIQTAVGDGVVTLAGTGEKSLTTHYYRSILRRAPDSGGKSYWDAEAARVQALGVNVNEVWFAMAGAFYSSPEYVALGRDNAGYVADLFGTFFNRTPDAAGLAYWKGQLDEGLPREVALAAFMFSQEFADFTQAIFGTTVTRKEVDTVVDFYRGLLGSLPDDGGFNYWLGLFRAAQCQGAAAVNAQVETISGAFANSDQYGSRARTNAQYLGDLYNAFLRRGGDLGGVKYWIDQIASDAQTRDAVRKQFVASGEFNARVNAIIAQGCLQ